MCTWINKILYLHVHKTCCVSAPVPVAVENSMHDIIGETERESFKEAVRVLRERRKRRKVLLRTLFSLFLYVLSAHLGQGNFIYS